MSELRVEEFLERFRKTKYYLDVIWQNKKVEVFRRYVTEVFPELDETEFKDKFREMMRDWFMKGRMEELAVENILDSNDYRDLKLRLLDLLLNEQRPIQRRLEFLMGLRNVGPFFASQFLSAVGQDKYIVYHDDVLEGVKSLLPKFAEEYIGIDLPAKVRTADEYMKFNEVCSAIRDAFSFRSLAEVHEFFWHCHGQGAYKLNWF
jgi:hypothetical protein